MSLEIPKPRPCATRHPDASILKTYAKPVESFRLFHPQRLILTLKPKLINLKPKALKPKKDNYNSMVLGMGLIGGTVGAFIVMPLGLESE